MSGIPAADIRAAREARGWDQAELARRIGVRQQTVSRWERGQTAPFGENLSRLRSALGLDGATPPLRRPLLEELPFNRLDAYQFEAFCEALASRLYPDAREISRYGVSGDTQYGIDVRVVSASGERIGIQCKKYEKFQPASFAKAVAKLDRARTRVDRCVLFLSTRASAAVQEACDKLDEWTIWDARTLSREVARLPSDQALSLLDRFFPDMREEFLGVRVPSVWQTTGEAFPSSVPSPVYSHSFRLVGRAATLDEMTAFADGDNDPRIAVLTGVAGQGKSRLLCELARIHDRGRGTTTRVLLPGPVTTDAFEHLPTAGRLLVLIEDAHERSDDLAMIVTGILWARPHARLVITTRPYGKSVVQQALRAAKVDEREIPQWDLPVLRPDEAYALASEILGTGKEQAARVVAHVTADSPLILVNAATALQRGDLDVSTLQSHDDVHRLLLDVFVRSALSRSTQPDADRALLHAVAALQPVAMDVPHFQDALSGILRMPDSLIRPQLLRLEEEMGVVVRRGSSIRISPDLLGDVLLAEAAVNPQDGAPTEYLRHLREHSHGDALANALLNAGRVDWQWRDRGSRRGHVVDPLWAVFEAEFKQGGAYTRTTLLRLLVKIAPFQPQRVLDLARWALENPTTHDDRPSEVGWMPGKYSQTDVVRGVPRILEAVAVDLDLVRGVYDLLWSLGDNGRQPSNRATDAPLRVLLDLSSYAPGKPLAYQEILLDALPDWLEEAPPNHANRMPLALLDPLFANTAEARTREGWTLTLSRHPVNAHVVAPFRERAIGILLDQYGSTDERRAVAAATTFREILRHQTVPFEPYNIEFLQELGRRTVFLRPSPLVALATRRSLGWSVRHSQARIREAAQAVVDALPDGTAHRLAVLLHTGTYDEMLLPHIADADESLESAQAYWEAQRRATLEALAEQSPDEVATLLVSLVEAADQVFARHSEGVHTVLVEALAELPGLAPALIDRLADSEDGTVRTMLPAVLQSSFGQDATRTVTTCRQLVTEGSPAQVWAVARAFQEFVRDPSAQEADTLELARDLAVHPDPAVRAGVLDLAVSLLGRSRETALDLLVSVPFGDLGVLPHSLCWAFTRDGLLSWQGLTEAQRIFFLNQLTALPSLGDYIVQQFVAYLARIAPETAVDLLCARVERWEEMPGEERYEPLPHEWGVSLPFPGSPLRMGLLRSVLKWSAQSREDAWRRHMRAPDLFWTVAGHADESVLGLLLEPYLEGDSELAQAVSPLLSKVPEDILWDRVDFVTTLLKTAYKLSESLFRGTAGSLQAAVFSGVRWGEPGKPYQEDLDVRERAQRISAGLPQGSSVYLFYKALQDTAQHNIDRATDDAFRRLTDM